MAIDRSTGGAAAKKLWVVDAYDGDELTLRIESRDPLPEHAKALLDHVVWDIHDGLVGVGSGSNRGYGTLQAAQQGSLIDPDPVDLTGLRQWADEIMPTQTKETE